MADAVTIKVDATKALAKFSPSSGIPAAVAQNLRRILPGLTRRVHDAVESKLDSGLKSRRRIEVKQEIVDNAPKYLYGRVRTISTSEPFFLPQILESGAKAHPIYGKNRPDKLLFFENKAGQLISKHMVNHPGFAGIHYAENAFAEMESEIRSALEQAVRQGAREAK